MLLLRLQSVSTYVVIIKKKLFAKFSPWYLLQSLRCSSSANIQFPAWTGVRDKVSGLERLDPEP